MQSEVDCETCLMGADSGGVDARALSESARDQPSSLGAADTLELGVDSARGTRGRKAGSVAAVLLAAGLLVGAAFCVAGLVSRPEASSGHDIVLLDSEPCKRGKDGKGPCKAPSDKDVLKTLAPAKDPTTPAPSAGSPKNCAAPGADCSDLACCSAPGTQCYMKSEFWSECRPSCAPGPDPTSVDGKPWNCTTIGPRAPGSAPKCAAPGEDCRSSKCCTEVGMQCFVKNDLWGACRESCTPGIDLTDMDMKPWKCTALGTRAPGPAAWVASQCSVSGKDCRKTKCCRDGGMQCYSRDDFWAQCEAHCTKGADPNVPWNLKKWSCDTLGSRTPLRAPATAVKLAPWVATKCSGDQFSGDNCIHTKCCKDQGMQCYQKTPHWGSCKPSCTPGPDLFDTDGKIWSCGKLGPRTPGKVPNYHGRKVSKWVASKCAPVGKSCKESMCCKDQGLQCFEKNKYWATCDTSCSPGNHSGDKNTEPWSCKEFGVRTPRPWGKPSLFCFSCMRTVGYEVAIMRMQVSRKAGIFGCDEFDVYSSTPFAGPGTAYWHPEGPQVKQPPLVKVSLGIGPLGRVDSIPFHPAPVGMSQDGTAGNTELFLHVWELVRAGGKWQKTDWTVKADPDAVLLADRLRGRLLPQNGKNTYVVNCNKGGMAPMMFGAVEVFSRAAMQSYYSNLESCKNLPWQSWGEDYFMGHCLDMLKVLRTNDFDMVSDGVCKGVDCGNPMAAAFHPKKDVAQWVACLDQATR